MTACTMPSDYGELMLGSSPVMGSGFHGVGSSFFSDYSQRCGNITSVWGGETQNPDYFSGQLMTTQFSESFSSSDKCRSFARTGSLRRSDKLNRLLKSVIPPRQSLLLTTPAKSILRQLQEDSQAEDDPLSSLTKEKKRVSFADTQGHILEQIKIITEKPDCPPTWNTSFIEKITGGVPVEEPECKWEITFAQPSSDFLKFKNRLDTENVCLENIVVDTTKSRLKGTIKVRNLSFHKDVTIRYTTDRWFSTNDIMSSYILAPSTAASYNLYDRFGFEMPLPDDRRVDKIEFCVRFCCDGTEYWDNNNGHNYTIISFKSKPESNKRSDIHDPYLLDHLSLNSWSEFASWNHLPSSDAPYW